MRRPLKGNLGIARWSFEAPILLTLPFALLAVASLCADTHFTATRWVGSIALLALCAGSVAAGVRVTAAPVAKNDCTSEPCSVAKDDLTGREIAVIETSRLREPLVLSGTYDEAQLRIAFTFGGIAIAALIVVACLLAGQVQRAGPVSAFAIILSLLLIGSPAAIALHLAAKRVFVHVTPKLVRIVQRKGFFSAECAEWQTSDLESFQLLGSGCGTLVQLVIEGGSRRLSVPLCGLGFDRVRTLLSRAGY